MTSIVLPFSPRVSVFDWDYESCSSDRISVIYTAQIEQRQLVVRKFCPRGDADPGVAGSSGVTQFRTLRLVYVKQLETAFITSAVHSWLSNSSHFLLNCRVNTGGLFRSCLLVFDSQLALVRTMYFGLTTFPCYCYSDSLFYLPGETENCIKRLSVPDLRVTSVLDCTDQSGLRYVPQESKSPFQVSVSEKRILLCSFYTISRRVVLNAYTKDPFQLQAEMRLDFSPMRYVDSGPDIIWFEGGPQQHRVKIRYVTIDQGFFVSDKEDHLSLLVPSRFTVPWLGSIWLFANRRGHLHALECPNFEGAAAAAPGSPAGNIRGQGVAVCDSQLCTSIDLHRERRGLFSKDLVRDLINRMGSTADGDCSAYVIYHERCAPAVDTSTEASAANAVVEAADVRRPDEAATAGQPEATQRGGQIQAEGQQTVEEQIV